MAVPVTVNLDDDVLGALEQLAKQTGSSRDWLVSRAVEAYALRDRWQVGKIEQGIAAADLGDFATDAEVQRVREKFTQAS